MSKCKAGQCETEDKSIIEELKDGEKRFSFPKLGISVIAKSLKEAEKKVKQIREYQNKSI